jgi:hypothetical protein
VIPLFEEFYRNAEDSKEFNEIYDIKENSRRDS